MSNALGANYVLDRPIGQGATGEVWRGHRRSDDHLFAFKLLRPQLLTDQAVVGRFLQERGVLTGIEEHPNLVHVHDLVVEGQTFAIVMDLVDGGDLRRYLTERRTLPPREALRLMSGVLTGVARLHAAGVVHRDLKPENTLLEESEGVVVPRLTDYGTARLVADAAATRTTSVIGTPEYLAPELADRGEVSAAADVYSAGIMLYELLCGVTPFVGGSPVGVLRRHIDQDPGRPDHVDDRLWDLLSRMLAKRPGGRPLAVEAAAQTKDLAVTLAAAPALPKLDAPPPPPPGSGDTMLVPSRPGRPGMHHQQSETTSGAEQKKSRLPLLLGAAALAAVLAGVGVGIAVAGGGSQAAAPASPPVKQQASGQSSPDSPAATATASPSTTPSLSATPTPSSTPSASSPAVCVMPDFQGQTVEDVNLALSQYGITPKVTYVDSDSAADGAVLKQEPAAGQPCKAVVIEAARHLSFTWLADSNPKLESEEFSTDVRDIDGRSYQHSFSIGASSGFYGKQEAQYSVSKDATRLTGRVGSSKETVAGEGAMIVSIQDEDGHPLWEKRVSPNHSHAVDIPLRRIVTLRFIVTPPSKYDEYKADVVFGNLKVLAP